MAEKSGDNPGRSDGKVCRIKWKDSDMKAALEAVSSGKMTVSASSRVFKVPRKTLDDRVRGIRCSWNEAWSYHCPHI